MLLSLPFALSAQTPIQVEKSIRSFELGEVVVTVANPADSLSAVYADDLEPLKNKEFLRNITSKLFAGCLEILDKNGKPIKQHCSD